MGAATLLAEKAITPTLRAGVQGILKGMPGDEDDYKTVSERINAFIAAGLHVTEERDPGFHASQMFYLCPKRVILDLLFPEHVSGIETNIEAQRIFGIGHAVHEWVQNKWLGPAGIIFGKWQCYACDSKTKGFMPERCPVCDAPRRKLFYVERKLRDRSLNLVGHADGVTKLMKKKAILEVKTINPDGFKKLKQPLPAHYYQVNVYMHLSKLQHAVVFYVNKSSGELAEFVVDYDQRVWNDVCGKIGTIRRFLRRVRENGGKFDYAWLRQVRGICYKEDHWIAKGCHQIGPCFRGEKRKAGQVVKLPVL